MPVLPARISTDAQRSDADGTKTEGAGFRDGCHAHAAKSADQLAAHSGGQDHVLSFATGTV